MIKIPQDPEILLGNKSTKVDAPSGTVKVR